MGLQRVRHNWATFTFPFSHPYTTTGKIIALTIQTFVSKVMSLLFSTLSRFVLTFLPRGNHCLISWLQSPSAVILEPKKLSLSLFPLFHLLFAMKWCDQKYLLRFGDRINLPAAAAAKSLQSCPTLCDPTEGSPVPGILQARTLEWVAISLNPRFSCLLTSLPASRLHCGRHTHFFKPSALSS